MRTKFKVSILSMLAIVFTFAFVLVGCGDSKTSGETISLTEAKTLIVSALATDDNPDNRSIFAKFGKTQAVAESSEKVHNSSVSMNAQYEYSNGTLQKVLLDFSISLPVENLSTTIKEYSTDINKFYRYSNDENNGLIIVEQDFPNLDNWTGFLDGNIPVTIMYLLMYESLFTDDAFENVYNSVTKINTSSGYNIALTMNYEGFLRTTLRALTATEDEFNLIWENGYQPQLDAMGDLINSLGTFQAILEFNNNNQIANLKLINHISGQTTSPSDPSASFNTFEEMTISPYTGEITEPQWVTDYLAEQSQAQE